VDKYKTTGSWLKSLASWRLILFLILLVATNLSIAVGQISLGLSLLLLIFAGIRYGQWPPRTGVEVSAAWLALWALAMIPFSADVAQSTLYFRRFFLFSALWVASAVSTTEQRRFWMLGFLVAGAMAISLYGKIKIAMTTGGVFTTRFFGASNPMSSGAISMLVVLVVIGFLFVRGYRHRWRLGMAVAALPVLVGLLQTMTRSAFLGTVAGIGTMILLVRPRLFLIFLALAVVFGVGMANFGEDVVSPRLWSRINPEYVISGKNTTLRLEMWRGGWEMIKAHPLTGVGDCDLIALSPQYYGDENTVYHGHLHSNPVMLAVIWGVPGFILAQLFIFTPLILLVKRWRSLAGGPAGVAASPALAGWILGAVGAWAGFYVAGFTEWYFGDAEPMVLYLAIIGVAFGTVSKRQ